MVKETSRQAFSRAAGKPEGLGGSDFLEAILRERPDLRGQPAYLDPEQGICARTVRIGDEIFKGPQSERFVAGFDREYQVLQGMAGKGLPVPEVTCVGKDTPFFGMKRMAGVQLAQGFFENVPEEEQRLLARDIARFVTGMAAAFPLRDTKFMVHGDLHLGNVLIDPQTRRLAAVIDFGLAGYVGETEIDRARGVVLHDVNDWLPMLRTGEKGPNERLSEFNAMLHEEYRLLRKRAPASRPAVKGVRP